MNLTKRVQYGEAKKFSTRTKQIQFMKEEAKKHVLYE